MAYKVIVPSQKLNFTDPNLKRFGINSSRYRSYENGSLIYQEKLKSLMAKKEKSKKAKTFSNDQSFTTLRGMIEKDKVNSSQSKQKRIFRKSKNFGKFFKNLFQPFAYIFREIKNIFRFLFSSRY